MSEKQSQPSTYHHPVVAVGASAGGLEALKTMMELIPSETRASFVILQHLSPDFKSQLATILGRTTHLPCREAAEDMPIEPGQIYVLPPDRYLKVVDHGLFVEQPDDPRGARMPIDHFMRSLAETAGTQAVGVVLSGTGSDGTQGLQAIRAAGGITFAQKPETALYDGMPRSAIASNAVDQVGTIESICDSLVQLAHDSLRGPTDEFTQRDLHPVMELLGAQMNFDFASYKIGTIGRRVKRRMNLLHLETLADYADMLRRDSAEMERLFDDLLINVTAFFRDPQVWQEAHSKVIAPLVADEGNYPLRIWVPACSSGEEAYSLAMLVDESCREKSLDCDWQIFATDFDAGAIAAAREAIYPHGIAAPWARNA